jgi:OOP family OmpA-OmpF porin
LTLSKRGALMMDPAFYQGSGVSGTLPAYVRARSRFNVILGAPQRSCLAALALLLLPGRALADTAQLDRFEPAAPGSRFFAADSLELDGDLRVTPGVASTYGRRLRIFGTPEGTVRQLVASELVVRPGLSIVLAPGARFALSVPVYFQSGQGENLSGHYYEAPRSPVLGDTRLGFDLRLAGPRPGHDGVTLASGVAAYLPSGSRDDYTSDDYTRVGLRLAAAARARWLVAALSVGYMYRRELDDFGALRLGSELEGTFGLGWTDGAWVIGPEVRASTILRNQAFKVPATPVESLFGVRRTTGDLTLGVAGGPSLVHGVGTPDYRLLADVEWTFGRARPADRDHDGVMDDADACPDVPGPAFGPATGCPEAPRDRDGDGVVDAVDACPDVPGVHTADAVTNGCADRDHDGIPDPVDACPSTPGAPSADARKHGCPLVHDADGDGIPDASDACPSSPGAASADRLTNGCVPPAPLPPDRDKDGVADADDACPDDPGKRRDDPTSSGCPLVRWGGDRVILAEPLQLSADGPTFAGPEAFAILDAIAAWFAVHEEVQLVRIEAYSDEATPKQRRQRAQWTAEQARIVRDELIRRGVAKTRIEAKGMGDAAPLAPNDTPEDRAKNRRIELRIVR